MDTSRRSGIVRPAGKVQPVNADQLAQQAIDAARRRPGKPTSLWTKAVRGEMTAAELIETAAILLEVLPDDDPLAIEIKAVLLEGKPANKSLDLEIAAYRLRAYNDNLE